MAWRPPYQPQFPHARCGRLVAPQRGQALRADGPSRHDDARRLRLFDFDIFFFGTAMGVPASCGRRRRRVADTTSEG
jgi:hypothetical protein